MTTVETPRQIVTTLTADGAAVAGKHTPVDATSGNRTLTLPTAITAGAHLSVEKVDSSTHTVTVTGSIRGVGASSLTLAWQYESVTFVADAAGSWWPTAGHKTKAALDATYAALTGATFAGEVDFTTKPWISLRARGAFQDGTSHPLSGRYATLTAAQAAYPLAGITSLTQETDWAAFQDALNGLPMSAPHAGGCIVIDGHVYLGNDGIVSTARSVYLLNLGGISHGSDPTTQSGVISGTGTQVLLTVAAVGSTTDWAGWRCDNITFRDLNSTLTGMVRLVRRNKNRFNNCNVDFATNAARGYAFNQDGGGNLLGTGIPYTASTDTITLTNHGLTNDVRVMLSTFVPVNGFDNSTAYYVINATTNTFQLSLTSGGAAIDITADGTGTFVYGTDLTTGLSQYNEFTSCTGRNVHLGYVYQNSTRANAAADTIVVGGMLGGSAQPGSIGMMVGSSMRAMGCNIQNFERDYIMDGNVPMVSNIRSDNGGATGTAYYFDVLATAKDATIDCPKFGANTPSSGYHFRLNLGHTRTTIISPSTNQSTMPYLIDPTDTQLTMLDSINGLSLGLGKLNKHASGVLQAVGGVAGKAKAGTVSDADYSAAPPDGAWAVNTTAGALMFRSAGAWKSLLPTTGASVGKLGSTSAQASLTNSTVETTLASLTVPGGTAVVGSVLRFTGGGSTDNIATSGTLTIKVKVAGVTVAQFAPSSAASARTAGAFGFSGTVTYRVVGGTASLVGNGIAQISLGSSTTAFQNNQTPGSTFDSRNDQVVTVTAQWATADPGNTIRLDQFLVELA